MINTKCGSIQGNQFGTQESVRPKAVKRQSKRMSILCGAFSHGCILLIVQC